MRESQLHQAFSKWLDSHGIPYVHSRTDKKTSTRCGDPDYFIFWCSHVVAIEIKVGRNKLSPAQQERIAYLRRAGNKVAIAYSIEEAIEATKNVLCIENDLSSGTEKPDACDSPGSDPSQKPEQVSSGVRNGRGDPSALFIGNLGGADYVFRGDRKPGGQCEMVRRATASDVINLR